MECATFREAACGAVSRTRGRLVSLLQNQRYRAVVDQFDVHHRAKLTGLDGNVAPCSVLPQEREKPLIQGDRNLGWSGAYEAGAPAFAGIAIERELWNDEQPAVSLREVAVHLALGIPEYAQPEDLLRHPLERGISVGWRETGEHEKAGTDSSGNPAFHPNLRAPDSLEDDSHSTVTFSAASGATGQL